MRSGALIVVLLLLGGCVRGGGGNDNSLLPTPPASPLSTGQPAQTDRAPAPVVTPAPTTASPTPTGFSDSYVVPCNGTPTGAQVIAVVRKQPDLLPAGVTVTVQTGPMCIGKWQYTILVAGDHEPLQVVTKGVPPAISFVTAGTDVCTVDVRANAPVALLDLATC